MLLLALLTGCGTSCEVDAPLDYAGPANWLCTPDDPGACPDSLPLRTVAADGSVTDGAIEADPAPAIACFAVYPTLDLRLAPGLHHDVANVPGPEGWARSQAGPLREVCDLYVPVYRQVLLGTYVTNNAEKQAQCFDSAFGDVLAAFEEFLRREPNRPFVLFGHSQGGQHLSRLIRERIETDPAVLARMVVAYPTGWPLGTDAGSTTGGSFETVPTCSAAAQTGCVVGFRTYVADHPRPEVHPENFEGDQAVCVDPASPDDPEARATLAAFTMAADHSLLTPPPGTPTDALVRYEGAFEATCRGEGQDIGLEVRWARSDDPPVDLDRKTVSGTNGSHVLDLNLTGADIVQDIRRRASALP
ncbi:MAG: DUF3089 domain-containing protein [Alphaproteobacteria bacterium]|nr:DUF3089 domain-containing protein [Alphaproteobacteria bacterium]